MAKQFQSIDDARRAFIENQQIFFVATAAAGTRINISPRATNHLHVLEPNTIAYLDLTGSGSETSAHLKADGRMTVMLCAFDGPPLILRLYGTGRNVWRGSDEYNAFLAAHYAGIEPAGARQIVFLEIDLVQTSCGFAVPYFDYRGPRETLARWAQSKGEDGLRAYRAEKNSDSMDGLPTGLPGI